MVDGSFVVDLVHLAAVLLRHAAPGRQGAVVAVATFSLEAQLTDRAQCHTELICFLILPDGAEEAAQVVTEHRGEEKVEPQHGNVKELQHIRPAS